MYKSLTELKGYENEVLVIIAQQDEKNSKDAKNILYSKNKKLIYKIAHKYKRTTPYELEELIGESCVAFTLAINKYKPDRNAKFSTFAAFVINRELLKLYDRLKHNNRYADISKLSLNEKAPSGFIGDGTETEYIDLIAYDEDYTNIIALDILTKGLEKVDQKYIPYMLDILYGKINRSEVAKKIGVSRQAVNWQVHKFMNHAKAYVEQVV